MTIFLFNFEIKCFFFVFFFNLKKFQYQYILVDNSDNKKKCCTSSQGQIFSWLIDCERAIQYVVNNYLE